MFIYSVHTRRLRGSHLVKTPRSWLLQSVWLNCLTPPGELESSTTQKLLMEFSSPSYLWKIRKVFFNFLMGKSPVSAKCSFEEHKTTINKRISEPEISSQHYTFFYGHSLKEAMKRLWYLKFSENSFSFIYLIWVAAH